MSDFCRCRLMEIREDNYKYSPTNLDLAGFILLTGRIKGIMAKSKLKQKI